jgi:glycerol-3-phosphate dehydrogenase (NAD(P)+)
MPSPRLLFIGHGKIGSAIHHVLTHGRRTQLHIDSWDVDRSRMTKPCELADVAPGADMIFLCVPSWCLADVAHALRPYLSSRTILIGVSKGLDRDTFETLDQILESHFPKQPFALLFGPMLADELLDGRVGAASVASRQPRVRHAVSHLFTGTALRTVPTADVRGVAMCGVLKNIYAVGLGIAKELKLGDNFNGWYVEQSLAEMRRILQHMGGKPATLLEPAGIGDFVATGFSILSKNVTYGRELALHGESSSPSEGAVSLKPLAKRLGATANTLPLFTKLQKIVLRGADPRTLI